MRGRQLTADSVSASSFPWSGAQPKRDSTVIIAHISHTSHKIPNGKQNIQLHTETSQSRWIDTHAPTHAVTYSEAQLTIDYKVNFLNWFAHVCPNILLQAFFKLWNAGLFNLIVILHTVCIFQIPPYRGIAEKIVFSILWKSIQ